MKLIVKVLFLVVIMLMVGCGRWPNVVIGDSSGYLQYNRSTGILEILWEKHVQVRDTAGTKIIPDSIR
jgi:hypothetical protein